MQLYDIVHDMELIAFMVEYGIIDDEEAVFMRQDLEHIAG